jgi:simple sugar transport system permease protein
VAINLLALGLTRFLLKLSWGSASSTPELPGFHGMGDEVFMTMTAVLVIAAHALLMRTAWGLRVRASGEHPEAVDSLGVSVERVRWQAVLLAGALAGLGGAWLMLDNHGFVDRMSGGRGYLALAAMILGRWRPLAATAACLAFGFADALQTHLQVTSTAVPRELVQMLPYLLALVALAGAFGKSRPPAALGRWFSSPRSTSADRDAR